MRYEIERTLEFDRWLKKLKDRQAVVAISMRLSRIVLGNFGDAKPVGDDVHELRLFIGPGYRMYYTIKNDTVIVLLVGGDKSSQEKDIRQAKELAIAIREAKHEREDGTV